LKLSLFDSKICSLQTNTSSGIPVSPAGGRGGHSRGGPFSPLFSLTCIFQSFFSPPAATCWLPVAPRRGEGASYLSRPFFTWSQTESQHFVSRTCNGSTAPVLLQPYTQHPASLGKSRHCSVHPTCQGEGGPPAGWTSLPLFYLLFFKVWT